MTHIKILNIILSQEQKRVFCSKNTQNNCFKEIIVRFGFFPFRVLYIFSVHVIGLQSENVYPKESYHILQKTLLLNRPKTA